MKGQPLLRVLLVVYPNPQKYLCSTKKVCNLAQLEHNINKMARKAAGNIGRVEIMEGLTCQKTEQRFYVFIIETLLL